MMMMQVLSLLDCNIYKHATHFHKDKQKLDINKTSINNVDGTHYNVAKLAQGGI